jgi:small subunit ribosomal protein S8
MYLLSSLISKINLASKASKKYVFSPNNALISQFLKVLILEGFISSVVEINSGKLLKIFLKYHPKGVSPIKKIKLLSTPNKSFFISFSALAKTHQKLGTFLVSTTKGIYTGQNCLKHRIGGFLICFLS